MWGEPVGHHFGNDFRDGMDKTDGSEVGDVLGTLLLQNESNVGGVQPMKVSSMEIKEMVDGKHDIWLDGVPTCLEKGTCESIRTRCLVAWHGEHNSLSFLLGEGLSQFMKVIIGRGNDPPIDVNVT